MSLMTVSQKAVYGTLMRPFNGSTWLATDHLAPRQCYRALWTTIGLDASCPCHPRALCPTNPKPRHWPSRPANATTPHTPSLHHATMPWPLHTTLCPTSLSHSTSGSALPTTAALHHPCWPRTAVVGSPHATAASRKWSLNFSAIGRPRTTAQLYIYIFVIDFR